MIEKIRFELCSIGEIPGNTDVCVVVLIDRTRSAQLAVLCDYSLRYQLRNRLPGPAKKTDNSLMLPEALADILTKQLDYNMELVINDIVDGKYMANIVNRESGLSKPVYASEAILFHVATKLPLYVTADLVKRQGVPYVEGTNQLALPYNVLPDNILRETMQNAVDTEEYELASHIRDELKRRGVL